VVGFCYPAAKQPALDSLTLSLAADKMTALVGPSGGGKSSALSLLLRFYQPTAGCITIGGVRLERLPNRWLREHVGVVAQEPTLFRGTFHDNIAFGARRAPPEGEWSAELLEREVRRAAVAANAHGFISTAGGYGAAIGERGGGLSGGQRQRIALARAYLRAPSVLLLDEATASLDAESERAVHDALALLARGRAVLTVAHRLATVRAADEIVVLERGRVVERGTHEALVAAAGLYARLNALQTHSDS